MDWYNGLLCCVVFVLYHTLLFSDGSVVLHWALQHCVCVVLCFVEWGRSGLVECGVSFCCSIAVLYSVVCCAVLCCSLDSCRGVIFIRLHLMLFTLQLHSEPSIWKRSGSGRKSPEAKEQSKNEAMAV